MGTATQAGARPLKPAASQWTSQWTRGWLFNNKATPSSTLANIYGTLFQNLGNLLTKEGQVHQLTECPQPW